MFNAFVSISNRTAFFKAYAKPLEAKDKTPNEKSVDMHFRYAWMILFAMGSLGIFLSIPYIILGQTIEPKGAAAAREISDLSLTLGNTVTALIRVLGLSYLVVGVLSSAIAATSYRKGDVGLVRPLDLSRCSMPGT